MDIPEQKYKKLLTPFRSLFSNLISQYPLPLETSLPALRNLKYLIDKQKYCNSIPVSEYSTFISQIKVQLEDTANLQGRMLAVRMARCLPFQCRVKMIQQCENQLSQWVVRSGQPQSPERRNNMGNAGNPTTTTTTATNNTQINANANNNVPEFNWQSISDMIDLMLSVYNITMLSQQIYFDVNQKITSIVSRIVQKCWGSGRDQTRNCYEGLRQVMLVFGPKNNTNFVMQVKEEPKNRDNNKLISKIINILTKSQQNYVIPSINNNNSNLFNNTSSVQNNNQMPISSFRQLILKTREYQTRVRCRMLTGLSYLLTYLPYCLPELYELISKQIFIITENTNQFDVNLQCFLSLGAILSLQLSNQLRSSILKKWVQILSELNGTYKKQYFPFSIKVLKQVRDYQGCPLKVKYFASINFLQITNSLQQQLSRYCVYNICCRNIISIMNTTSSNSPKIIQKIFQYTWLVDRARQQNDLFRCQFLICLLHADLMYKKRTHQQIGQMLDLCHMLIDWGCSCKRQTDITTIKFAFDVYLKFLSAAAQVLGNSMERYLKQLVSICNGGAIYFLFKFKLLSTIVKLPAYSQNILSFSQTKLDVITPLKQAQIFMMPPNGKPIFDLAYSLTPDGQAQSQKQLETVKVVMEMFNAIQQAHRGNQNVVEIVNTMVVKYHQYLNNLEQQNNSNKDLINCLQSLEADYFFTDSQRNFLLSLVDLGRNTIQYTLNDMISASPLQSLDSDEEYNIFGSMSPVHLKIRLLGGRGFTSVFIQAKKSQWVGLPEMKLVISSAVQIKQVPFESCILQIKIDRSGLINFQAWTVEGPTLLLGSGSHRINRKYSWLQVDHLQLIDGIRSKAFLTRTSPSKTLQQNTDATYLTCCYGEPVLLQIIYSRNQIVVTVSSRQVWLQVQELIGGMVESLMDGSANIIKK